MAHARAPLGQRAGDHERRRAAASAPDKLPSTTAVEARHGSRPAWSCTSTRAFGERWTERYALRNTGAEPVDRHLLGHLHAVARPLRLGRRRARARRARARRTGGAYSYALAEPMDGAGPVLGLRAARGRAVGVLDRVARAGRDRLQRPRAHPPARHRRRPRAARLRRPARARDRPGASWRSSGSSPGTPTAPRSWPPRRRSSCRTGGELGSPIPFRARDGPCARRRGRPRVRSRGGALRRRRPRRMAQPRRRRPPRAARRDRPPPGALHPRPPAGDPPRRAGAGALLPYDTERGLTVPAAGWAGLLRRARAARHGPAAPGGPAPRLTTTRGAPRPRAKLPPLRARCVLTHDHQLRADSHRPTPARGSTTSRGCVLLLAEHDPDRALAALRGYYARGGARFLAIGAGLAARELAGALRARGRDEDAAEVAALLHGHALRLGRGRRRPARPRGQLRAVDGRAAAGDPLHGPRPRAGDERSTTRSRPRLPWLLAFGGPQPHVRLRDIAIRHWDGYWFGREQLWGDTFPHHWSALTANVLMLLPEPARRGSSASAASRRGDRRPHLRRQPRRLRARRQRDGGVRVPELRLRPHRPPRRPARQRPGLGALLAAAARSPSERPGAIECGRGRPQPSSPGADPGTPRRSCDGSDLAYGAAAGSVHDRPGRAGSS